MKIVKIEMIEAQRLGNNRAFIAKGHGFQRREVAAGLAGENLITKKAPVKIAICEEDHQTGHDVARAAHDFLHIPDHGEDFLAGRCIVRVLLHFAQILSDAEIRKRQTVFLVNAARTRGHDQQALTQKQRFFYRVGNQEIVFPVFSQLQHKTLHLPGQRIERAEGFIHQDHVWIIGKAWAEHALLHPPRQLIGFS